MPPILLNKKSLSALTQNYWLGSSLYLNTFLCDYFIYYQLFNLHYFLLKHNVYVYSNLYLPIILFYQFLSILNEINK